MRTPGRAWVLPVVLAACTAPDDTRDWAGTTEALPNGAVRVTSPAEGIWGSETAWRLAPELAIGELEGDDPYVFAAISGLAVDSAGRILVLDGQANELRIFSPGGEHVRTVGQAGDGPGEYTNANGLDWLSEDTLVVVDQRGARYTVLTREGEVVQTVPRRLPFFGWVYSGGIVGSRIYEVFSVGQGADRDPALLGTLLRQGETTSRAGAVAPEDAAEPGAPGAVDTVMLPKPSAPLFESFSVRTERGGMAMAVPFTARPVHSLDGAGLVWHGHGSARAVYRGTLDGDTLSEILFDWPAHPVTEEEIAEWTSGGGVQRFRDMGGELDMDRIPRSKAFFDDIVIAESGHIWLTVPAGPAETVFAVLDPEGRYLGRLAIEGIARESHLRPVVRPARLYFVGRDELDVQRVYVYRIER